MSQSEDLVIRSRFKANKPDGTVINLRIQDIRKCDIKKVTEYIPKHFIKEENWCKCAGVPDSAEAIEDMMKFFNKTLETTTVRGLICCLDNTDDNITIVGHSLLKLINKSDPLIDLVSLTKTEETKKFFTIIKETNFYNVFDEYEVEQYLAGAGLSVDKEYKGMGIATELLKARRPLMLELGLSISTGFWMTSEGSQKASVKAGYKIIKKIKREELERLVGFHIEHGPDTYQSAVLIL